MPLVGSIPLHPDLAAAGDAGDAGGPGRATASWPAVFAELARVVAEEVAPLVETEGCTARLIERVEAAVARGDGRDERRRNAGRTAEAARPRRHARSAQRVSMVSSPAAASSGSARPSWPSARRWAHSENRATGSWRSVTSP